MQWLGSLAAQLIGAVVAVDIGDDNEGGNDDANATSGDGSRTNDGVDDDDDAVSPSVAATEVDMHVLLAHELVLAELNDAFDSMAEGNFEVAMLHLRQCVALIDRYSGPDDGDDCVGMRSMAQQGHDAVEAMAPAADADEDEGEEQTAVVCADPDAGKGEACEAGATASVAPVGLPAKKLVPLDPDMAQALRDMYAGARSKLEAAVHVALCDAAEGQQWDDCFRHCKMYAMLGFRDAALDVLYNRYIKRVIARTCAKLRSKLTRAEAQGGPEGEAQLYVACLTHLFESIAQLVASSVPLLVGCFGLETFMDVLQRIQAQCDAFSTSILKAFIEQRVAPMVSRVTRDPPEAAPGEALRLVEEMVLLCCRCQVYCNFLIDQLAHAYEANVERYPGQEAQLDSVHKEAIASIRVSGLHRSVQEIMSLYGLVERFFLESSTRKALHMCLLPLRVLGDQTQVGTQRRLRDSDSSDNEECGLDLVGGDDVSVEGHMFMEVDGFFYVLASSCRRAMTTGNRTVACTVVTMVAECLSMDFMDRVRHIFGFADRFRVSTLCRVLNDVHVCARNLLLLPDTVEDYAWQYFRDQEGDREIILSCLSECPRLAAQLRTGVQELLMDRLIVPHEGVNQVVSVLSACTYELGDNGAWEVREREDAVGVALRTHVTPLLRLIRPVADPAVYEATVYCVAKLLAESWEPLVLAKSFTALGALRLDAEVAQLQRFFQREAPEQGVRALFARLHTVTTLLQLDHPSEAASLWDPEQGLDASQVRSVLSKRVDFQAMDIARLRLPM